MRGCVIITRPRAPDTSHTTQIGGFTRIKRGVETQCLGHRGKSSSKLNRSGLNVLVISLYVEIRTSQIPNTPPPHILLSHYISLFVYSL
nr:MAG TPA: hypothetical protein [Caudoviricetes sp.]